MIRMTSDLAHGLSDGVNHPAHHPALAGCLIQGDHDVIHRLPHQLSSLRYGLMGMGCLWGGGPIMWYN